MDRPLLVSAPLVHPIRDEIKTLTSRLQGLELINEQPGKFELLGTGVNTIEKCVSATFEGPDGQEIDILCPYGQPGDRLWVRENWYVGKGYDGLKPIDLPKPELIVISVGFIADGEKAPWAGKTRASIHMPRWASRYTLELLDIKVGRVQDLSEEEAMKEGCGRGIFREGPNSEKGEFQLELTCKGSVIGNYFDGFKYTWMTINGRESWNLNPWVWRLFFKLVTPKQ